MARLMYSAGPVTPFAELFVPPKLLVVFCHFCVYPFYHNATVSSAALDLGGVIVADALPISLLRRMLCHYCRFAAKSAMAALWTPFW